MLMTREQIRQDTFFDGLTEAILERDQPRTADLYFQMVARQRRSVGDALGVRDDGRGALRAGAEPHQHAGRADHPRQQRPHDPGPAHLGRA